MRTQKTTKLTVLVLTFIMMLTSMVMFTPFKAEAASVQRKISDKAVTIDVGKTYGLAIERKSRYWDPVDKKWYPCWPADASINPKWSSNNTKVATVSKNGKVTGKTKGTATITAKVGKTTYKCKVTVLRPVSMKNIKIKEIPTAKTYWVGSIFAITNKNDYAVYVSYKVIYTKNGKKTTFSGVTLLIGPGETAKFANNGPGDYDKAEIKITDLRKSEYKSAIDDIEVKLSKDGNTVYVKNNAKFTVTELDIMCYKKDENGLLSFGVLLDEDAFSSNGLKTGKTYKCRVNEPDTNWLAAFGTWVEPDGQQDGYTEPGKPDCFIVEQASNEIIKTINVN